MIALSVIVVTSGRETLTRTLLSIKAQGLHPQDEVLVVGNGEFIEAQAKAFGYRYIQDGPFGNWGQVERQHAMAHATGTHLLFIDDDDFYLTGAFEAVRKTIRAYPDRPLMFKMFAPTGLQLWMRPVVEVGNISGTQFVIPNDQAKLGVWGLTHEGDYDFIVSTLAHYPDDALVWDSRLIVGCRDSAVPAVSPSRSLRVLLVHPGASWSTADVEAGLRYGLQHHGVEVIPYRLDERIEHASKSLHVRWRQLKKSRPDLPKPNTADLSYQASVGALEMALRHHVDVVIIVSAMLFHPDVIAYMKKANLKVTVVFTESPYDHEQELRVAAMVDGCWTNERTTVPDFRRVNRSAGYLPHGWHPERHSMSAPLDVEVPSHDVVFVGSGFPERVAWFNAIDWTGIDLGLYGSWEKVGLNDQVMACVKGGPINNAYTAGLYRRAKVGLNLYRTSKGWGAKGPAILHAESLSPRAYELAACGAFHLSEYRAEVAEQFGALVPTFTTPTEAAALIRLWLTDPEGRARVSAQLPATVAEASWVDRAKVVLGDLQTLLNLQAA